MLNFFLVNNLISYQPFNGKKAKISAFDFDFFFLKGIFTWNTIKYAYLLIDIKIYVNLCINSSLGKREENPYNSIIYLYNGR